MPSNPVLNKYQNHIKKNKSRLKSYQKKINKDKMKTKSSNFVVRIQPDIKWFGNTRIIGEKEIKLFENQLRIKDKESYTVILKRKQLPISFLMDIKKKKKVKALQVDSKRKNQRKKPTLVSNNLNNFVFKAMKASNNYNRNNDTNRIKIQYTYADQTKPIFLKGQSNRIKRELFKVIDSSDVLIQVLDSRDPLGTRLFHVEKYLKTHYIHKHLILVLNKVDLIPAWCTARWVKYLSQSYPTLAFHAHVSKSFGKGSLIQLLRQFARLYPEQKKLNVGFFGYPNVGKSSIINTLKEKLVCKVAPTPGETKVWQYITLTSNIYLIDCPGVCYSYSKETDCNKILKGVVRVQNIKETDEYIDNLLRRIRPEYLEKAYGIRYWKNSEDFLIHFAKRYGKLLKGGIPDFHNCAIMILQDWQRGKLPWFICPPFEQNIRKKRKKDITEKNNEEKKFVSEFVSVQLFNNINKKYKFLERDTNFNIFTKILRSVCKDPSKDDLKSIKVIKPLNILTNDPILMETRRRKWKSQQKRKK